MPGIKVKRPAYTEPVQRTQASAYYESLQNRLANEAAAGVPRSRAAWGVEQNRLGSWASGVGTLRPSGQGINMPNGEGRPAFVFDPDEINDRSRR